MTTSCLGIKSSIEMSNSSNPMDVLLSSPYLSLIMMISSLITPRSSFLSARIAFNSPIFSLSSLYSFSSFSRSSPVSARRRMSTIACDCTSDKPKRSINSAFAACTLSEPLMMRITSSILSSAMSNPSKMWARSSALLSSYFVRRVTTSSWCSR